MSTPRTIAHAIPKLRLFHFPYKVAQLGKNPPAMQERPGFHPWVEKIPWRMERPPTPVFLGFPVAQLVKNLPAMRET